MRNLLLFLFIIPFIAFAQKQTPKTPADVVQLIKKNVSCAWAGKTVDTFKAGNPETPLKGIAVCMFADMNTLTEAVKNNCNFIITHEPVFYNHLDETDAIKNDEVFQEKMAYIEENGLVIFRFHDHIHRTEPDGIYEGMIHKLGWKRNAVKNSHLLFEFDETQMSDFSQEIKEKLGLETVRIIGDPKMKFTKVGLAVGAPGGSSHIRMLQNPEVEVLVAGEAPEWETYLYANDAVNLGKKKAVIFLGHIKSEEAGMEYCAEWLNGFISGIPIHFIENNANFSEL
jgi:putative NIF3 family GTP cyclohydrolase 1 type 2